MQVVQHKVTVSTFDKVEHEARNAGVNVNSPWVVSDFSISTGKKLSTQMNSTKDKKQSYEFSLGEPISEVNMGSRIPPARYPGPLDFQLDPICPALRHVPDFPEFVADDCEEIIRRSQHCFWQLPESLSSLSHSTQLLHFYAMTAWEPCSDLGMFVGGMKLNTQNNPNSFVVLHSNEQNTCMSSCLISSSCVVASFQNGVCVHCVPERIPGHRMTFQKAAATGPCEDFLKGNSLGLVTKATEQPDMCEVSYPDFDDMTPCLTNMEPCKASDTCLLHIFQQPRVPEVRHSSTKATSFQLGIPLFPGHHVRGEPLGPPAEIVIEHNPHFHVQGSQRSNYPL